MKAGALWQVSVQIAPEAEEAVVELVARLWAAPASVHTDVEAGRTTVSVFLENLGAPGKAAVARKSEGRKVTGTARCLEELRAGLQFIRQCGLNVGAGRISLRRLRREDWAESWKRHFQPLEIGPTLLIKPDWSRRRPLPGQAVVVLNPGLSFGTGQHPTTRFCLAQLAAVREADRAQSFLDIGCGSGILAIAAAKLGYRPVEGFDFDPAAVRIAQDNARQNEVAVRFRRLDLTRLPLASRRKFAVVCANLTADLLEAQRSRILSRLGRGGRLVLAGIVQSQFPGVCRLYRSSGLELVARDRAGEWESGAFVWA
jgi:ribosomal protein L11 methyltransferase